MKTATDLADILLPGAVKAAIRMTGSPCPRTSALAWQLVHRYLASPVALAATMQADAPQVTALHAELLQWSLEAVTDPATGNATASANH